MQQKRENIAIVAPPWWLIPSKNVVTATEHLVEDFGFHLRQHGYDSIIFSRAQDYTDDYECSDVYGYNNKHIYTRVSKFERKILRKNNLFFYFFYILKTALKIRILNVKKIMVLQTFPFCFWIRMFNPRSKIIFHIGGHELSKEENYFNYGYISNSLGNKVIAKIDYIIAVSKHIQHGIIKRFPHFKAKVKYVYAGIDTEIFKFQKVCNSSRNIIFAGRVVLEKGVLILVSAFKNLKRKFKDIKLFIIGESLGPNLPVGFEEKFKFKGITRMGLLSRRELAKALRKGSIFVYPVIMEEAFGLSPVEAMATGLITVVSDSDSGYKEIIKDKVNGYYFQSENQEDLERVLGDIFLSLDKQESIRHNALQVVKEKLAWDKCVKKVIKIFNS